MMLPGDSPPAEDKGLWPQERHHRVHRAGPQGSLRLRHSQNL